MQLIRNVSANQATAAGGAKAYLRGFSSVWSLAICSIVSLQVGCPEARIDENVAKLTAAGYKVTADSSFVKSNQTMR